MVFFFLEKEKMTSWLVGWLVGPLGFLCEWVAGTRREHICRENQFVLRNIKKRDEISGLLNLD